MLEHVNSYGLSATICTMYRPNFEQSQQKEMSEVGLAALNDVIITGALQVNTNTPTSLSSFDLLLVRLSRD